MTNLHLIAAIDLQGLVWLVIFFFWIIAQIVGQKNKGKRPPPTVHRRPPVTPGEETAPSLQDELKEIFESMTGVQMEDEEEELEEEIYTRPPVQQAPVPPPLPVRPPPSDLEETEKRMLGEAENPFKAHEEIITNFSYDALPDLASSRLVSPSSLMIDLSALNTPKINVPLTTSHKIQTSEFKPKFRGTRDVKKAMISRIILGPPVGLQDELGSNLDPWRR